MEEFEKQEAALNEQPNRVDSLYVGLVLANNDPHQMGRVRVLVYGLDEQGWEVEKYRWVPTMQALMGVQIDALLGPAREMTKGYTAYGNFGIPKIGTIVCLLFIGGEISNPVIVGSLPPNDMISGLPAGNLAKNEVTDESPQDILPIKTNMDTAFGGSDTDVKATRGFEVTARAAGSRAGAPDVPFEIRKDGDVKDDRNKSGYPKSSEAVSVGFDNEPTMYSFTSPGQHTVLMNDDPDNCRIRIRTVSGNQIILDDTNERIYISTSLGNNYIEMDADGTIDIYSANRINLHSAFDINIKSDKQVNIEGVEGINLKSTKDIKISTDTSTNIKSGKSTYITSGDDMHIKSGGDNSFESGKKTNILSSDTFAVTSSSDIGLTASGSLIGKGSTVDLNGSSPPKAVKANPAISANPVNREPQHESDDWRSIDDTGKRSDAAESSHNDQTDENPYGSIKEGGEKSKTRLDNWRK